MVVLVNRAKMTTSTTGTGTITLGSVVDGYQTFAAAGVSNGDSVRYVIEDGTSNWEIGSGTYTASGTTLSRTPSESSDGGSAITLSGDAIVFISAIASDIQPVTLVTTTFTATAGQTAFTVSYTVGLVEVFLNGAKLSGADFTATNGTSIVLASGANAGDTVDVIAYGTVSVANTYTQAQADALFVDVAGDTMTGDLNLGDSIKVQFGADQDLQIYHDGSNSYLRDGGTGDLKVLATNFAVKNLGDSINFITTNSSTGAMDLYHNGTSRLTTTSTGVDITGTLTSDGLTVDGTSGAVIRGSNNAEGEALVVANSSGGTALRAWTEENVGVKFLSSDSASVARDYMFFTGTSSNEVMRISSAGNVGIGTSSPSDKLHVEGDIRVNNAIESAGNLNLEAENGSMRFQTGSGSPTERMRIDSSGNLLVGKTSVGFGTAGIELRADDSVYVTRSANTPVYVNRLSTDGDIVQFSKDGTTVGSIGSNNGNIKISAFGEEYASLSGTTPTVDCQSGNNFALSTTGNTTFTFSNPPTSGTAFGFTLKVTAGGTHTLTWPSSVDWAGGTAPDAPASGETNVLVFITYDGGTTWYGFQAGAALA